MAISLEWARQAVLAATPVLDVEPVGLDDAVGRVLARNLSAPWDLPAFDSSAVDGYAVRSADLAGATRERPVTLAVVDRLHAGSLPSVAVGPKEAVRVASGAPLPRGADAVLAQEEACSTQVFGARGPVEVVAACAPARPGANVRCTGCDLRGGAPVLCAGLVLDPAAIAILAAFGRMQVPVVRRPRVGLLAVGDELVPGERAARGAIVDSDSHRLHAQAQQAGARAFRLGIVPDDPQVIARFVSEAAMEADVLVTVGGAARGDRDRVRVAFDAAGAEVLFWGVAFEPGGLAGCARLGRVLVFALPGDPLAAEVAFELLVRPALRRLQGAFEVDRPKLRARLSTAAERHRERLRACPAELTIADDGPRIALRDHAGPGALRPLLGAGALALIPPGCGSLPEGWPVEALLIGASLPPPLARPSAQVDELGSTWEAGPPDQAGFIAGPRQIRPSSQ